MEIIGKPTISKPLFYIAKYSIVACVLMPLLKGLLHAPNVPFYIIISIGLPIFLTGALLLFISLINLGRSTRIGIPNNETKLKITGLYRITRNPMYLGVFMLCIASCIYFPHWLNIVLALTVLTLHHFIIRNEEKFLAERFGKEWTEYTTKVRRYL